MLDKIENVVAASNSYGMATPTMGLRYAKNGELQQAWQIVEHAGGRPIASRVEWRGIPVET